MRYVTTERAVIANSPQRRPYGARFSLQLEPSTRFQIDAETTFLLERDIVVRVAPGRTAASEGSSQSWNVYVEGFATAGEAEKEGQRVVLGFLWAAVFGRFAVRLSYRTPLPCEVYLRTESHGMTLSGEATLIVTKGIGNIVAPVGAVAKSRIDIEPKLLLALELFTSARLETTERSKYIGLVSSLEPLAFQGRYDDPEIERIIEEAISRLDRCNLPDKDRASIRGRIEGLRQESVSAAIRHLVRDLMADDQHALDTIEEAYSIRSKILHEGSTDADLAAKGQEVETIIRSLLERKMQQYLR